MVVPGVEWVGSRSGANTPGERLLQTWESLKKPGDLNIAYLR